MSQDTEEKTEATQGVGVGGQSPGYNHHPPGQNRGQGPQAFKPTTPPAWFQKYAETTENLLGRVENLAAKTQELQQGLLGLGEATKAHLGQVEQQTTAQLEGIFPKLNNLVEGVVARITEENEKIQAVFFQQIGQFGALPQPENIQKMLHFSENFQEHMQRGLADMDLKLAQMEQISENFARSGEGLEKSVESIRAETRAAFLEVNA